MLNQIPCPLPDYQLQELDHEIVIYHPSHTRILYLNQSASLVWGLCDGQRTTGEIIGLLSEAYPDAAEEIAADVQATVRLFLENGSIEMVGSPTP